MSRLDHFLILYRSTPEAPPFSGDEKERLVKAWGGPLHFIEQDSFLIAWAGLAQADARAPSLPGWRRTPSLHWSSPSALRSPW